MYKLKVIRGVFAKYNFDIQTILKNNKLEPRTHTGLYQWG